MNIIAFDTASDIFSVGLSSEGHRYCLSVDSGQKHSELIMDAADTLIRLADISKTSLEAVACMEGPGSFTGLRIGFSAAKGLALALDIPIIPVPTLDCMVYPLSFWPGLVLPVMDAKKNAFFTALYSRGNRLTDYLDIEIEPLIGTIAAAWSEYKNSIDPLLLITGPAAPMVQNALAEAFPGTVSGGISRQGYVEGLLNLAIQNSIINRESVNFSVGPLYLRKSDAELTENMDNRNV
ncbi:MAG: tRNA (adenosine(37)-N6)-threonylcarbamoyltransferase complex dimerization subunit type 1 TsaB [Treponema sp.]|nr:tRNA (adenosine(37)-N6)-threonylcarbamoyltransferase complex dimerization subunit type 1 TsaB [Treponema sp.]